MRSVRIGCRAARRRGARRFQAGTVAALTVVLAGVAAGCGVVGSGAKPAGEAQAPTNPVGLRQDVDRLRADLAELRALIEVAQRAATEHADRAAGETRTEVDAVQKALEASARHDLQRQVEVLDAQARRIDLLDKRAAEQGQTLRRLELALTGIESQLTRVLENPGAAPARGAKSGAPARPPAAASPPATADEPASKAPPAEGSSQTPVAGADLAPPAMLGLTPGPRSSTPTAKPADAPREAKAAPVPRSSTGEPPGGAKTAPAVPAAKAAPTSRSSTEALPRPAKPGAPAPPAGASSSARAIFDRAMESWKKGETGQAVLDFEELAQTFPGDPLVAPAQFRIGEAYYAARDFERAALGYRKAIELAPQGKDTPQALLRLGLAYRAQKRESDARQAWNQLVRDFPESEATEEARRALRSR
jgi:TolA-binding protein